MPGESPVSDERGHGVDGVGHARLVGGAKVGCVDVPGVVAQLAEGVEVCDDGGAARAARLQLVDVVAQARDLAPVGHLARVGKDMQDESIGRLATREAKTRRWTTMQRNTHTHPHT